MDILKKLFFLLFVFSFFLVTAEPEAAGAASGETVTKEIEYYTNNSSDKIDSQFPELIQEQGKMYRRKDITYKTVNQKKETIAEPVTKTVKSKVLKQSDIYNPDQTMEEDGITYHLQETTSEVVTKKKGSIHYLSSYTDYLSKDKADAAPAEKDITVTDPDTLVQYSGKGSKTGISKRTQWKDSYITIHFTGYDANRYQWNGMIVEKNEESPLKGYKSELLQSVGIYGSEMKNYKVGNIFWTGKAYRNQKGVLCRDAKAAIKKKISIYRVSYQGIHTEEDTKGMIYHSTYAGIRNRETGIINYQMKATALYELQEEKNIPVATITIGILLFLIVIIGVIHLIVFHRNGERKKT